MSFIKGDVVRLRGAGSDSEKGTICSVNAGGYWVFFPVSGCLYVPLNSLVPADGKGPECPEGCPPG